MSELIERWIHHGEDPKIARLSRVPLFAHVPRRQLAVIATNLNEVRMGAAETLIREGHHNDTFWILLEGEADLVIGGEGHQTIGPDGFFGVTSMLDGRPAVGTVVTRTPIRALVASAAQFRAIEGSETVTLRLMSAALERMREDLEIQRGGRRRRRRDLCRGHRGSGAPAAAGLRPSPRPGHPARQAPPRPGSARRAPWSG